MATPTTLPAAFVAGNVLTAAQMNDLRGAFRVLQVVSTAKTDTFSATSTSYTDITGLSVSITPTSADSKVLVFCDMNISVSGDIAASFQLVRGSTAIALGDAAGSRTRATFGLSPAAAVANTVSGGFNFLDSPATTSATTYKVQLRSNSGTVYINRTAADTDTSTFYRSISTITVMEISA